MSAICNKDKLVKKLFKDYKREEKIIVNLKAIYLINNQKFLIKNDKIKIGKKPLSRYQLKLRRIAFYASISFIFIVSGLFATINFTTGFGLSFSPFMIKTESQLFNSLSGDNYYKLTSDLVIDKANEELVFSGNLDGNNHTVYIKSVPQKNIIKENNGTIKNLNIVYDSQQKEISTSLSLFVENNKGVIDNVNISCKNLNLTVNKNSTQNTYINGFANFNNGIIKNSSVLLNINVSGVGNGECYVSGFVGKNNKTIENCALKQGSNLVTTEADLSGLVFSNELKANVLNCKNYATLQQTSIDSGWSPNVAGVVLMNYGNVKNCYNYGKLTAVSTYEAEEVGGSIYLGGIVAVNYSVIDKCLNKGELIATSNRGIIYCGGINAFSNYYVDSKEGLVYLPVIKDSGVECNINASSTHESAFVFVGGIVGRFSGRYNTSVCGFITNCFSITTFTNGNTTDKYFVGNTIGCTEYYNTSYRGFTAGGIIVLNQSNVAYQIGSYINNSTIYSGENIDNENVILTFDNVETIKQQEVYWNE